MTAISSKLGVEAEGYRKILCQTGIRSSRDMSEYTESYLRNEGYAVSVVWCVIPINERFQLLNNTSYLYMIVGTHNTKRRLRCDFRETRLVTPPATRLVNL